MIFSNFWRWTLKKHLSPRYLIYLQRLINIKNIDEVKEIKKGLQNYIDIFLNKKRTNTKTPTCFDILTKIIEESNVKIFNTDISILEPLSREN